MSYLGFDIKDLELIQNLLKESLSFISKYEKLSKNEGQIKLIFGEEVGLEIYAPHLIPNALSQAWLSDSFETSFKACTKDLKQWFEIEKDAPKDKFWVDIYS